MCEKTEFWNDLKSGKFAAMVRESTKGQKITNAEEVYNTMKPLFADQDDVESFYCIFLNAKNKVLAIEKMFSGSISCSSVYPREIVKRVIALKSTSVVLIHNHPSGDPEPSRTDISITTRIGIALDSIGVCVHDHIIIGDGFYSMAGSGELKKMHNKISDIAD
jgi:DNA repair protein RadC